MKKVEYTYWVISNFRCFLVSFTIGFAILSTWISNTADIIYTRSFDPLPYTYQDVYEVDGSNRKSSDADHDKIAQEVSNISMTKWGTF